MHTKLGLVLAALVGGIVFALADGLEGVGIADYICTQGGFSGTNKILGVYNGCTTCTSDAKHGDGSCGNPTAGQGTLCTLVDIQDTSYFREKRPQPICVYCYEEQRTYFYKDPYYGAGCSGDAPNP